MIHAALRRIFQRRRKSGLACQVLRDTRIF